jgi:predicted Zn-dependent protease
LLRIGFQAADASLLDVLLTLRHISRCPVQVHGVLLFQLGRVEEAREVLRQGVGHNPSNPQLCMEWALAEEQAGNLGKCAAAGW